MQHKSSIDPKYADLVHVWELGNYQYGYRKCIQEQHWMSVVRCVRGYQIPDQIKKAKHIKLRK